MVKIKHRLSTILLTALLLAMFMSMTAFAASDEAAIGQTRWDSGDAIQDILAGDRFQGAMSSIQFLTDFIDIWFIRIISVVSFFIISSALLKNVCAGAYVANSKFWDKVDEAHKASEAWSIQGIAQGVKGFASKDIKSIKASLLAFIPNIKAFTDFEDADIEPKAYFLKAIPQMIACVVIGVFIYNGYYRDTAATVGDMGSILINRTLTSVQPDSFLNKIFNTTSWPDFPWEGDKSRQGQFKLKLANEYKKAVASNYTDLASAQSKAIAVDLITKQVDAICDNSRGWYAAMAAGGEGEEYMWKVSSMSSTVSAGVSSIPPNVTFGELGDIMEDSDHNWTVRIYQKLGDLANSTLEYENMYVYVNFVIKREINDGSVGLTGVDTSNVQVTNTKIFELDKYADKLSYPNGPGGPGYIETSLSRFGMDPTAAEKEWRVSINNGVGKIVDQGNGSFVHKNGSDTIQINVTDPNAQFIELLVSSDNRQQVYYLHITLNGN